jgi:hypothetical protein
VKWIWVQDVEALTVGNAMMKAKKKKKNSSRGLNNKD